MTQSDIEKVLAFLISKLSPADLEELDAQMTSASSPMASDARFGTDENRRKLLALSPEVRQAARQMNRVSVYGKDAALAMDAEAAMSFEARFPDAKRFI